MYQSIFQIRANRYAVHAKIDGMFAMERIANAARRWHINLVALDPIDQEEFIGTLTTLDEDVLAGVSRPIVWKKIDSVKVGEPIDAYLHVTPKFRGVESRDKSMLSSFRESCAGDHQLALSYARERLSGIQGLHLEFAGSEEVIVNKKSFRHQNPGAWMRVTGSVGDAGLVQKYLVDGIGGARTFGCGRLIPKQSDLYQVCHDIREGQTVLA